MHRILSLAAICVFFGQFAVAITPVEMRAVFELIGFDKNVAYSARSIHQMDEDIPDSTPEFMKAWKEVSARIFNEDEMMEEIIEAAAPVFDDADHDGLIAFFTTGIGRMATDLEVISQAEEQQEQRKIDEPIVLADLVENNPSRLAQIHEVLDALGTIDHSVAMGMNFSFAFMIGMQSTGKLPATLSQEQILAHIQSQEPEMRENAIKSAVQGMAYTYRYMSNEELAAYIVFLQSDLGRKLYAVLEREMDAAMIPRTRRFGREVMQQMGLVEL